MATLQQKRTENIEGNFYVDSSCIDCDTCRWVAPQVYNRQDSQSAVYHQPATEEEKLRAMQALLACPTASIGTVDKPTGIKQAQQTFPIPVADNVYYCGYHSAASYGAASYFIQRPEGNILVDSPRFAPPLVKQIEQMGGIKYMYLTHQDDVADHQKFHQHFNCDRILHSDEVSGKTKDVEIKLTGNDNYQLADKLLIINVPGHTKGHTVLLYDNKFLFSGDHLAWSDNYHQLIAFPRFCWYSWSKQIESMQKLANYTFQWVLPGHGRRYHGSIAETKQQMQQCVEWMKQQ